MKTKESRFPAPTFGGRRLRSTALNGRSVPLVPLASLDLPNRYRRVAYGSVIIILLAGFILALSSPIIAGDRDVEHFSANPDMQLPFSDAVRVGNMLYLSGKIGNIPGTRNLAEGGITGQTRQALENIKASLEKYGSSLDEVVKCTVFLADIAEWGAMNEVYMKFFPVNPPARSALGASGLALNSRVEIECFAAMRG